MDVIDGIVVSISSESRTAYLLGVIKIFDFLSPRVGDKDEFDRLRFECIKVVGLCGEPGLILGSGFFTMTYFIANLEQTCRLAHL